ncbi:MAG: M20 family metallopeptidase [Dehalococcoidia bacterium]
MDIRALKDSVIKAVEAHRQQLRDLSLEIHDNPELGFNEVKASALLTKYLEDNGFKVERGICELPTAFRGSYGKGRPAIAVLAEYDALPQLGHACGHNLIAGAAVGAAVAARAAIDECGGSVLAIGTPAEEFYGGKALMAEKGAFDKIDAAMMVHPGAHDSATTQALACITLDVEFFGKSAHAATRPETGINALEAMLISFAAINALRQHTLEKARIHGIISDGGKAPNVVPAHSAGSFLVRAEELGYLEELKAKVLDCFKGAATATGARLEYQWGDVLYAPLRNNMVLAELFRQNIVSLGRDMPLAGAGRVGSTDMGNVSQIVPGIHPTVGIAPESAVIHSPEFAAAAASEAGIKGMLDAAKALAMTVVDLVASPETAASVKAEFIGG